MQIWGERDAKEGELGEEMAHQQIDCTSWNTAQHCRLMAAAFALATVRIKFLVACRCLTFLLLE